MDIIKIILKEYNSIIDKITIDPPQKNSYSSNKNLYEFSGYIYLPENYIGYVLDNNDLDKDFIELYLKGLYNNFDKSIFILETKYENTIGTIKGINSNQFYLYGYIYAYNIEVNEIVKMVLNYLNNKLKDFNVELENKINYSDFIYSEYDKENKFDIIKKYFN